MKTDDLERRLEELFASQAADLDVPARQWSGLPEVRSSAVAPPRRHLVPLASAAALVAVLTSAVLLSSGDGERVTTRGSAATGSTTPGLAAPAFVVETKQVSLQAAALTVEITDGRERRSFSAPAPQVTGDPGTMNEYTTLELTWQEHDVEMRLYIYFRSDGTDWWSNEIRTYDGRKQGEWITYEGEFFRSKLGSPFTGDLDLQAKDHGVTGRLRLTGMTLEAFRRPEACRNPKAPLALDAGVARAVVGIGPLSSYGIAVQLLDTATCRTVPAGDLSFVWTVEHPAIAAVQPVGARADIKGLTLGTTAVRVQAERAGRVVSEATVVVEVSSRANASVADDPPQRPPPGP